MVDKDLYTVSVAQFQSHSNQGRAIATRGWLWHYWKESFHMQHGTGKDFGKPLPMLSTILAFHESITNS